MRKLLVLLACSAALSGCMTEEGPYDSGDVRHREIRVDVFSHYWETLRINATRTEGDTLYHGDEAFVLLTRSLAKPSELPAHEADSGEYFRELFYKAKSAPENGFSCYYEHERSFGETSLDSADWVEIYADEAGPFPQGYRIDSAPRPHVRLVNCQYYPGKGFHINLDSPGMGTYVIRY